MLIKRIQNYVRTTGQQSNAAGIIQGALSYLSETEDGKLLMAKMLAHSKTGIEAMIDVLGCEVKPADNTKVYLIAHQHEVKASDIVEFRGYVAKGFPVPPGSVSTENIDINQCESCGVTCPDTEWAVSYVDGNTQAICNHCRTYMGDLESESVGNISVCQRCAKQDCSHHPEKRRMVQSPESCLHVDI